MKAETYMLKSALLICVGAICGHACYAAPTDLFARAGAMVFDPRSDDQGSGTAVLAQFGASYDRLDLAIEGGWVTVTQRSALPQTGMEPWTYVYADLEIMPLLVNVMWNVPFGAEDKFRFSAGGSVGASQIRLSGETNYFGAGGHVTGSDWVTTYGVDAAISYRWNEKWDLRIGYKFLVLDGPTLVVSEQQDIESNSPYVSLGFRW